MKQDTMPTQKITPSLIGFRERLTTLYDWGGIKAVASEAKLSRGAIYALLDNSGRTRETTMVRFKKALKKVEQRRSRELAASERS